MKQEVKSILINNFSGDRRTQVHPKPKPRSLKSFSVFLQVCHEGGSRHIWASVFNFAVSAGGVMLSDSIFNYY